MEQGISRGPSQPLPEVEGSRWPPLTCPVASVVEVDGEGARLVGGLPGRGGAVLVVGVGVVVVHVLASQHGGARRAAHGRGDEGVDEGGSAALHDPPGFVHHLQGPCQDSPRHSAVSSSKKPSAALFLSQLSVRALGLNPLLLC